MTAPEAVPPPPPALAAWFAMRRDDPTTLLGQIARRVDDSMITEIAEADYGDDVDEHRVALERIRRDHRPPPPGDWHPREVLELIRWSEPEDPEWKPGATGRRGHVMRAFACATLLAGASADTEGYFDNENETLIQLVRSVLTLGGELPRHTRNAIVWRLDGPNPPDDERPFFLLAILLLTLFLDDVDDAVAVETLARWIQQDERRVYQTHLRPDEWQDRWLLRTVFHDQRHTAWVETTESVLRVLPRLPDPATHMVRRVRELTAGRLAPEAAE